jgi:hypothetical protein
MIALQNRLSAKSKKNDIGKVVEVLIEGFSKRSVEHLSGRTSQNKVVVFPAGDHKKGEYTKVLIERVHFSHSDRKMYLIPELFALLIFSFRIISCNSSNCLFDILPEYQALHHVLSCF